MRLVVDASTLVAESLRARGRALLTLPHLDLVVAADAWDETTHELRKRVALFVERGILPAGPASELLEAALSSVGARVTVVPMSVYAERLDEALIRVPRDPRDAPTVALALVLGYDIWTNDHDFFGCGVPVWTTETLQRALEYRDRIE
jgi:predicted nucleic acid-binding protein